VNSVAGARESAPPGLRDLWRTRPSVHSAGVWALILALDGLPWPWGEDLLARLFAGVALVNGSRRRRALAWAAHRPGRPTWRLALEASAFRGRWVARSALLGLRGHDDLRRHVVLHGERHLAPAGTGTILLGFHLGPPNTDVALRVAGHPLAWFGHSRHSPAWSRAPWRALRDPGESLSPPDGQRFWPGYLYRARRILLDGGTMYIKADAWKGREFCRVLVPGGAARIMAGWVMLARQTGARVLPVMTHLAGRDQVITIHPPLPRLAPGDAEELAEWRSILRALIAGYVERFPEQCPALAFPDERYVRDPSGERPVKRAGRAR
jgi:lauroyl/myristoyl acyltransferase